MTEASTDIKLEKAIKELKREAVGRKRAEEELSTVYDALHSAVSGIIITGLQGEIKYANPAFIRMFEYKAKEEVLGKSAAELFATHEIQKFANLETIIDRSQGETKEFLAIRKDATEFHVEVSTSTVTDKEGKDAGRMASFVDISERKRTEENLKKSEKELQIKSSSLEEMNTALKVLLKRREQDKKDLEEKVLSNVKELFFPYLEKLKQSDLNEEQKAYADILEANLKDIISPFSSRLSSTYFNFTPRELEVADLIKHGKMTKEIAKFMRLSSNTIEDHRRHIRKKLGITNKRVNLRTHLLHIEK